MSDVEQAPILVKDVALPGETDRYMSLQRRCGLYALLTIAVWAPLYAMRWLGEKAELALDLLDRKPYIWREQMHALNRDWHTRMRRIRAAQRDMEKLS